MKRPLKKTNKQTAYRKQAIDHVSQCQLVLCVIVFFVDHAFLQPPSVSISIIFNIFTYSPPDCVSHKAVPEINYNTESHGKLAEKIVITIMEITYHLNLSKLNQTELFFD